MKRWLILATPKRVRDVVNQRVAPALPAGVRRRLGLRGKAVIAKDVLVAKRIEEKLWGGFSQNALIDLRAIQLNPSSSPEAVVRAARALSAWYASHGDFERGAQEAFLARVAEGGKPTDFTLLLEADSLMFLGEQGLARDLLERRLERGKATSHIQLTYANAFARFDGPTEQDDDERRLALINELYLAADLFPIEKRDASKPLGLRNICCVENNAAAAVTEGPKVSILMPAYEAEATLDIAVASILEQTWRNIELIIVDDHSSDRTFDLAKEYAARDNRVIALRQEENQGAYGARNLALKHATGTFVTVHDTDDWSHPQKIESHVQALLGESAPRAVLSNWVRCFEHLYFRPQARVSTTRVMLNSSSLMLGRELLLSLGGWDRVRIAGDTELIHRLEYAYGRIPRLHRGVPLSFALERPTSLTQQSATHVNTRFHGVRRVYRESARHWLATTANRELPKLSGEELRDFPAPSLMLPEKGQRVVVDLLVVMDFALRGGAYTSTLNYTKAALKSGLKVGILHYRRYDLDGAKGLSKELLELVQRGEIVRVAPGESVKAEHVIVGYPVILQYPMDLPPSIETKGLGIVTNQMSSRLYSGGDVQYCPNEVEKNVVEMFKVEPYWIPISDLVRGLMKQDGRYRRIHDDTWTPLIEVERWLARPVVWRGRKDKLPTIGRHARDHYTKWPSTEEAIRQAYCAEQNMKVEILGGADIPLGILNSLPSNWKVSAYGAVSPEQFLEGLDFYVHYPHEDYIEEFGRAVLEAMAAGVPVILPEVFRVTFGDAALYAEAKDVSELIQKIWIDQSAWEARVEAGRRFVRERGSWELFEGRFGALDRSCPRSD